LNRPSEGHDNGGYERSGGKLHSVTGAKSHAGAEGSPRGEDAVEKPDFTKIIQVGILGIWGGKQKLVRLESKDGSGCHPSLPFAGVTHSDLFAPAQSIAQPQPPLAPSSHRRLWEGIRAMYDTTLLDVPLDAPALGSPPSSSNFICVCCNCDRFRLQTGKWVDSHSPAGDERRTHGLCPDCFAKLYPEFSDLGVR
jgi:hypothetical protein